MTQWLTWANGACELRGSSPRTHHSGCAPKWLQVFWLGLTAVVPIYTVVVVATQMQRLK